MKKFLAVALCLVLALCLVACSTPAVQEAVEKVEEEIAKVEEAAPAEEAAPVEEAAAPEKKVIGFYCDFTDSYYVSVHETMKALADADPDVDWEFNVVTGGGTAQEQLDNVQNFITAGVDVIIVIQNNPDTTSECLALAKAAGIPYFGAAHAFYAVENFDDAAGASAFDFTKEGYLAGEDAVKRGYTKLVNVEGVLGQGSAAAQSLGYIQAYIDAGKDVGGTAEEVAANKPTSGGKDFNVVLWQSGGWQEDSAQKIMTDSIQSLGKDGFDSVYGQNDPMLQGIITAITDAGLDPANYGLYGGNGREIAWQWAKDGIIKADVNQPATSEGDVLYQMVKRYFAGEEYRKFISAPLNFFSVDNIAEVESSLVPFTDSAAYLEKRAAGSIAFDIDDPAFVITPGYPGAE